MCAVAYGPTPGSASSASATSSSEWRGVAQRLEVEFALRDLGGDRLQIWTSVAGLGDVLEEGVVGIGERRRARERSPLGIAGRGDAELTHDRAHHPHRRRPRAVRRADRLHKILEHGRAAEHPPRAERHPGERGLKRGGRVEHTQILVEAEHVADLGLELRTCAGWRSAAGHLEPSRRGSLRNESNDPRPLAHAQDGLERGSVGCDRVRKQVGDPVRQDRPGEINRLAAGATERDRR